MAVPHSDHYREALAVGDTPRLARRPCIHWLDASKETWIARERTLVLLGHEQHGVPEEVVAEADACVEIPMVGRGASLNVAVAGSLVLYRLAGLA
jgi:tRNA (guanosine-2'-O-)-methyltransferase